MAVPAFIIIIGIFVLCHFSREQRLFSNIDLPQASSVGCEDYFGPCLDIVVDRNGTITINDKLVTPAELSSILTEAGKPNALSHFMIAADINAPFDSIWPVVYKWREAGGQELKFIVTDSGKKGIGAISCSLTNKNIKTTNSTEVTQNTNSRTLKIIVQKNGYRSDDRNLTVDSLELILQQCSTLEEDTLPLIIVIPEKGVSFAQFMKPLLICRNYHMRHNLCITKEQSD
jgi:biopolymer transport protein ExbD